MHQTDPAPLPDPDQDLGVDLGLGPVPDQHLLLHSPEVEVPTDTLPLCLQAPGPIHVLGPVPVPTQIRNPTTAQDQVAGLHRPLESVKGDKNTRRRLMVLQLIRES